MGKRNSKEDNLNLYACTYDNKTGYMYILTLNRKLVSSVSTPTPRSATDFWPKCVELVMKKLKENKLEGCVLHDGNLPPFANDSNKLRIGKVPIEVYNYFLLNLPVENLP